MSNLFTNTFYLSEEDNKPGIIEEEKAERDRELLIAIAVKRHKDKRSFLTRWSDWKCEYLSEQRAYRYSRAICLLLSIPEEATDLGELVYLPHLADESITEYVITTGQVFQPISDKRCIWRLVGYSWC